jgi:hypothetical protein
MWEPDSFSTETNITTMESPHFVQVLKYLEGENAKEVFTCLNSSSVVSSFGSAVSAASHLPQELFAQWVASCAPVLDFQAVILSPMQWMRLCAACSQINRSAVTTLHLNAAPVPLTMQNRPLSEFEHYLLYWRQAPSARAMCSDCERTHHGKATKFSVGFKCNGYRYNGTKCHRIVAVKYAPMYDIETVLSSSTGNGGHDIFQEIRRFAATAPSLLQKCVAPDHEPKSTPELVCPGFACPDCRKFCVIIHKDTHCCTLSLGCTRLPSAMYSLPSVPHSCGAHRDGGIGSMGSDCMHALHMMGGAAAGMLELKHLGVHRLPLAFQAISALGQLLSSLACKLVRLTVTTEHVQGAAVFSVHEKVLFFKAVARLSSLQELVMPQWEAVVGKNEAECVEALYGMPQLRVVYVTRVKQSPAFPRGLNFRCMDTMGSVPVQDVESHDISALSIAEH